MTEQKYPAEIIETMAASILSIDPPYRTNLNGDYLGKMDWRNADHRTKALHRQRAIAALDALGLTVTEEWAIVDAEDHLVELDPSDEMTARRNLEPDDQGFSHRHVLHAETPWVEVSPDVE